MKEVPLVSCQEARLGKSRQRHALGAWTALDCKAGMRYEATIPHIM